MWDDERLQIACIIGIMAYWWMVHFSEAANESFQFLNEAETERAVRRIESDRGDVNPTPFTWAEIFKHFLDLKIFGFAAMFFQPRA